MSIIRRLWRVIRTWADRGVARVETPDVIIESALQDARNQRADTHAALHATLTAVIETGAKAQDKHRRAETLRHSAVALRADGRDDEALAMMRSALLEDRTADQLHTVAAEMEAQNTQLKAALTELDSVLAVAEAHAVVERARLEQAKGSRAALEARYGTPDGAPSPFTQLEMARDKVRHIQASAAATAELGALSPSAATGPIIQVPDADARAQLDALSSPAQLTEAPQPADQPPKDAGPAPAAPPAQAPHHEHPHNPTP